MNRMVLPATFHLMVNTSMPVKKLQTALLCCELLSNNNFACVVLEWRLLIHNVEFFNFWHGKCFWADKADC